MKKTLIVGLCALMFFGIVYPSIACEGSDCTLVCPKGDKGDKGDMGATGVQGIAGLNAENTDRDETFLAGADVTLIQNQAKTVGLEGQYRYDVKRSEHIVAGVVKINLWDILRKK